MDMMYWAMIVLVAFIAIWFFFVVPAERRHHERKLEMLQKRIDNREKHKVDEPDDSAGSQNKDQITS